MGQLTISLLSDISTFTPISLLPILFESFDTVKIEEKIISLDVSLIKLYSGPLITRIFHSFLKGLPNLKPTFVRELVSNLQGLVLITEPSFNGRPSIPPNLAGK